MGVLPKREDVIRVEAIELPAHKEPGEGLYEWRYMDDKYTLDIMDLEKEFKSKVPDHDPVKLLDRLQNFRKLYINIRTGEVST